MRSNYDVCLPVNYPVCPNHHTLDKRGGKINVTLSEDKLFLNGR